MQSEFFDKKIKDAADHHHPAYDEQAWSRMENLLDEHMPVKKDKRRRFLFILLFTLLSGSAGWFIYNAAISGKTSYQQKIGESKDNSANAVPSSRNPSAQQNGEPTNNLPSKNEDQLPETIAANKANSNTGVQTVAPISNDTRPVPRASVKLPVKISPNRPSVSAVTKLVTEQKQTQQQLAATTKNNSTVHSEQHDQVSSVNKTVVSSSPIPISENLSSVIPTADNEEKTKNVSNSLSKEEQKPVEKDVAKKKTGKNARTKKIQFFISVSGAPDISHTGSNSWGKAKWLFGGGIGLSIRDRFILRSGFYTSRKIYTAGKDDYSPPAQFWTYYPYLEKVDADCKVYEVPITASYQFGRSVKNKFLVSAGISSYFMKTETYNYFYKTSPGGPVYDRRYSIYDQNNHLFSILTISAGYKRNITQRLSFSAEPYFKAPIKGVGYGKVKLNSAGVLFSIGFRPFGK